MQTITMTFRAEVPKARRGAVLEAIGRIPGVLKASFLKAESEHPEIARVAYLSLAAQADVEGVLRQLRQLPEIEAASLPAQRKLM
jgi:hypothetical protein